ncbi:MAG TPA: bifunctional glutamine synthetase adenylyltransferase/deadenyltransferase, partial [Gammaproteobacteria bacterium]|nr:bifunctional glutamine synthetase adenylyltransferase/deadenyltransferase [Gammaproteobacteria bacterium]
FGKRILHMLGIRTLSGLLYEVDMRLRPQGDSGLLVNSLETFKSYQIQDAWTWEHQALIRARAVCGHPATQQQFENIRREVLSVKRDPKSLAAEVINMRQKMQKAAKQIESGYFNLKTGFGGITDIEFMVQYAVLCHAHDYPSLLTYPDNIRILEGLAETKLFAAADVRLLSDAYRAYRAMVHCLSLQNKPSVVPEEQFRVYCQGVQKIWTKLLPEGKIVGGA